MNRPEVYQFLKSFFTGSESTGTGQGGTDLKSFLDLVVSLKQKLPLSIPLLRDLAILIRDKDPDLPDRSRRETGIIERRIDRRYRRLCRVQEELGRLDFKKAARDDSSGTALEDLVFSQIDFSRYQTMDEKDFEDLFPEGLTDFGGAFFKKNFGRGEKEIQSLIAESYKKTKGIYTLRTGVPGETTLIISIMRTLETSLETLPLFTAEETEEELKNLLEFVEGSSKKSPRKEELPGVERLYPLLVSGLDNVLIRHKDGMTTKLFISPGGDLSGTFRPGNKPWTVVLIPGT